jgi:hypothetical protein
MIVSIQPMYKSDGYGHVSFMLPHLTQVQIFNLDLPNPVPSPTSALSKGEE